MSQRHTQRRPTVRGSLPRRRVWSGAWLGAERQPPRLRRIIRFLGCCGWSCGYRHKPFCALVLVVLTGCASAPPRNSASSASEEALVKQRLAEIFDAAETKDLVRLDRYHWYGPHFTKFAGTGPRLDAAAAREGEHQGLSALTGLKLRAEDLQVDVFRDTAVATFTMVATMPFGASAITKRNRGTLVFVKHEGSWQIVHEHFSATE